MTYIFESEIGIGETVYRKNNPEKNAGLVTGVIFQPEGAEYRVVWEDGNSKWHYFLELTKEYSLASVVEEEKKS